MSEKLELSISELRRKKQTGSENGSNGHSSGYSNNSRDSRSDDTSTATEETWIEPEPRRRRREPIYEEPSRMTAAKQTESDDDAVKLPFDPIRLADAVKRNLGWCILSAIVFGAIGLSWLHFGMKALTQVQLARRDPPPLFRYAGEEGNTDTFGPQRYTDQALINMVQSSDVLRRVAAKASAKIPPSELATSVYMTPDRDTEMVTIWFKGKATAKEAAEFINLYANEVVNFTRNLQVKDAKSIYAFYGEKMDEVNRELASLTKDNPTLAASVVINGESERQRLTANLAEYETKYELLKIDLEANNPIQDKLQIARDELADLLLRYTDAHPKVEVQRAKIKSLEEQLEASKNNPNARPSADLRADNVHLVSSTTQKQSMSKQAQEMKLLMERTREKLKNLSTGPDASEVLLRSRYDALLKVRASLAARQHEAELFQQNAPGYYDIVAPAVPERVFTKGHVKKSFLLAIMGGFFGAFLIAGLVVVREVLDDRIKTVSDLERATDLPVIGTLGDLNKMTAAEQKAWAFRTWTIMKGKLSRSHNQGFVCGVISAQHGEGRSTWVKLLVHTANERGLRVLTVSTKPSDEDRVHPHDAAEDQPADTEAKAKTEEKSSSQSQSLERSVLSFPDEIARQLNYPDNACPVVHIPLPGWVWNLERRKQWQNALSHWKKIDNLVLLVELPPASEPESVLLAEKLPQVIWLSDSGKVTLRETREKLETLRHGGCNLVGAVLNREPKSFIRHHLSRWFSIAALATMLSFSAQAEEAEVQPPPSGPNTNLTFSINTPVHRAPWQQKLTLGPGDVLNLGFFGETNLNKTEVAIGPDGRISYLQATDVMAAGMTVDELRAAFDKELSKYYRSPRTIVTPVTFKSKKYYMLGKVATKGVFTLDRPITVLEALANARGLETGLLNRNSIDLADLSHSFLVRRNQRIPIDFEKLFNEGDLSQNIAIEPDDFFYFPPANLSEVYVVGEVVAPGVVPYNPKLTVLSALAERGSFNEKGYKSRVLVIRGSLNHPQTFVVNMHDVVDGKMVDFPLKPKDIIFVSERPFLRAEELLNLGITGFIQSATAAWTGQYIGPFITKPFIHGIYEND